MFFSSPEERDDDPEPRDVITSKLQSVDRPHRRDLIKYPAAVG